MLISAPTTATLNPPCVAPVAPSGYVSAMRTPVVRPAARRKEIVGTAPTPITATRTLTAKAAIQIVAIRTVAHRSAHAEVSARRQEDDRGSGEREADAGRAVSELVETQRHQQLGLIHINATASVSTMLVTIKASARAARSISRSGGLDSLESPVGVLKRSSATSTTAQNTPSTMNGVPSVKRSPSQPEKEGAMSAAAPTTEVVSARARGPLSPAAS